MALPSKNKPVQRPYEYQAYPSVRYRLVPDGSIEHCQVANADDDALLGPGWVDTPTKCTPKPVAPPKLPAPPVAPTSPVNPRAGTKPVAPPKQDQQPPAQPPTPTGTTESA